QYTQLAQRGCRTRLGDDLEGHHRQLAGFCVGRFGEQERDSLRGSRNRVGRLARRDQRRIQRHRRVDVINQQADIRETLRREVALLGIPAVFEGALEVPAGALEVVDGEALAAGVDVEAREAVEGV